MSREEVAAALDRAAEALAEAALALRATDSAGAGSAPSRPAPAPTQAAGSSGPAAVDQSVCPKHGVPWESGTYGPFCKQMTDDPAWGKAKTDRDGKPVLWCRLTPKNAPDWLRVQQAAA